MTGSARQTARLLDRRPKSRPRAHQTANRTRHVLTAIEDACRLDAFHVDGTISEIINSNDIGIRTIESMGESSRCRLIDDAENVEPCDSASILVNGDDIGCRRHRRPTTIRP